jgi:hypothetical protein
VCKKSKNKSHVFWPFWCHCVPRILKSKLFTSQHRIIFDELSNDGIKCESGMSSCSISVQSIDSIRLFH